MKALFSTLIVLLSISAFADVNPEVSYICHQPLKIKNGIRIGMSRIISIDKFEIPFSPYDPKVVLTYTSSHRDDDLLGKKPLQETVKLRLKEIKSGSLFELDTTTFSNVRPDALFGEIGSFNLITAGPVPDGSWDLKISLGFVSSAESETDPMSFQKVILNCKNIVKNK